MQMGEGKRKSARDRTREKLNITSSVYELDFTPKQYWKKILGCDEDW